MLEELKYPVFSGPRAAMISGLGTSCLAYVISHLAGERPVLVIVARDETAYDLARAIGAFLDKEDSLVFPARDLIFRSQLDVTPAARQRLLALSRLSRPFRGVVTTSASALMHPLVAPYVFRKSLLSLRAGQEIDMDDLLFRLVDIGYQRVKMVEDPGQFSVRGGLIDIWPICEEEPVRLDFFGEIIETIRTFSAETGKSRQAVRSVSVTPADELGAGAETLFDYLPDDTLLVIDEPAAVEETFRRQARRYQEFVSEQVRMGKEAPRVPVFSFEELRDSYSDFTRLYHAFFPGASPEPLGFYRHLSSRDMEPFWGRMGELKNTLSSLIADGYTVSLVANEKKFFDEIKEELGSLSAHLMLKVGDVGKGFISPDLKTAVVTEEDILGKKHLTRRQVRRTERPSLALEDLKLGDYVVHEHHGIAIFRGINRMEVDGITREYVVLQYAGADRLFLPVDRLDVLTRYSGSEEKEPRLSKLGGTDWERTRNRVRESVREMAEELLALYARREASEGFAFSPDTPWQQEFEDRFPYEETPDQQTAIADVKRDMERLRPMDRLVCGDVGYGKTEVAMRAAFKAVMDHKQVAILVPTTVLAQQHYDNFKERFKDYPVVIEMVSRFKTAAEQKQVIDALKKGLVDIVIGTHRLLSRDVKYKDLGLLVVDEEHRFGVKQKEKIKAIKENVDVLSLSATPIPRTLHMAITGLRDMSVIETPPPERYPVTTYVMEYNPELIREAILKELQREGQVFFVHNRINDIELVRAELYELVPEARIAVAHGRMPEEDLARIIRAFLNGDYDILLSTSIIESGLDMPRVNTLVVNEADKMGLAQLYQIRGRVGRSSRLAYAYFTYRPGRALSETATRRLNAIREFTDLGSGMKIALRDLEIRGAGNLLGPEQHGHIEAVGFDLYCRLLEEECARLKGEGLRERERPQLEVKIDSFIPDDYIPDPATKIRVYKQALLASADSEVSALEEELADRFGPLPPAVQNLMRVTRMRVQAQKKHIRSITMTRQRLEVRIDDPVTPEKWMRLHELVTRRGGRLRPLGKDGFSLEARTIDVGLLDDMMQIM